LSGGSLLALLHIPVKNVKGGFSIMRLRTALSLASLFLLYFTVAVWSAPMPAESSFPNAVPEPQSLTGKIDSVGDSKFTLSLTQNQKISRVQFLIDEDTQFQGDLTIGSQATVDFRSEGERKIATRVTVLPSSGFRQY
jgi:hypothetical protein